MEKEQGIYSENIELLKVHLCDWCKHYDLKMPQNRESLREWIQLFEGFGEKEFAAELRAAIDDVD